jgi:hypothetical protein
MVLAYGILSLYFIVPALVALALCFLVWATARSATAGLVLILATFLLDTWTNSLVAIRLGVWIYPQDATFLIIGIALALRCLKPERLAGIPGLLLLLTAILGLQFLLGLLKFKTMAGVGFRSDYYYLAGALYFTTFRVDELDLARFRRYWITTASILVPVVAYRWAVDALGLDAFKTWYDATGVALRVINSSQTLFMAQAFAMAIWSIASGVATAVAWFVAPIFGSFIIVLQHRSVWVVAASAAILSFGLGRRGIVAGLALSVAIGLAAALVIKGASTGTGIGAATEIQRSAEMASASTGTFAARIAGWRMAMRQFRSADPLQQLIGQPYGSGYGIEFITDKGRVGISPHNYYIQLLLRGGLLGLSVFALLYASALYVLARALLRDNDLWAGLFVLLLATQILFYIPYGSPMTQGIILGLALMVAREARARATPASAAQAVPAATARGA